jgi:P-type Ca2+ transporter type 2C
MEVSATRPPAAAWAALPADEVMNALATSMRGLAEDEIAVRAARYGANILPQPPRHPWYLELGANFIHLFALLLWAGAVLAWLAGLPQLAWAIVAVVVINGLFSYWQEYRAERAVEELQAMLPRHVTVRRGGQERLISAVEIVPGDLLVLTEGEAIPADARVVTSARLRVDLSSLTGESRPVLRSAAIAEPDGLAVVMLPNVVLTGTAVASGRGEAVVFATGSGTEFGCIAKLVGIQTERPSPLQRELSALTRLVTTLAVVMGVVFFFIATMLGGLSMQLGFVFAIGIIVANVPEGLLPTLTLALAMGVRRMSRRKALVKRLSAVETLGSTTLILTDKTGTLTENQMTVREIWEGDVRQEVMAVEWTPTVASIELLRIAALCCDAQLNHGQNGRMCQAVGDPTEVAILMAGAKAGLVSENLNASPRMAELPFDSVRKRMTTVQRIEGAVVACVKGAPSEVLPRCTNVRHNGEDLLFDSDRRTAATTIQKHMAGRGLRVLAVATRRLDLTAEISDARQLEEVEHDLTLLGLLAMEDPPRREVPNANSRIPSSWSASGHGNRR